MGPMGRMNACLWVLRAPRVSATSIMVNSASFKNLRLSLAVDIQVLIANENLAADLAFDDVNITYFYPNKPDNIIGTGVIPGAILSKGGQVERTLRSEFDAPIATFGACCSSCCCPSSTWIDGPTCP